MDASLTIATLVLVLSCGRSNQMILETEDTGSSSALLPEPTPPADAPSVTGAASVTETANSIIESATVLPQRNCTTAKAIDGACVIRKLCGHSTEAIDLTLYAYRGYSKPCTIEEVCCPLAALLPEETTLPPLYDNFEFDDDD